ncbi:hypothetical protein V6Z11_D08G180600 [Gossypium hirsutum]|uniref:Uncharacterized protein n=2 Tax=Gossypium TaxID=3633 RepID=A0A5D2JWT8_GOSTO|nr:hypothetical protein ES288_D08G195800v1 [Gossypium darwinii]TYH58954.1 hypothetical protein ES332_D08G191400v1 [Gossypium tomentosum]TYH58956.1 hypothetical protein ES332_D08G191400v1 [Gossypium tomentosum]
MGSRNGGGAPTMIRRRQSDFKMSFNLALRSLLTTCSKEARILVKNFQNLQVQSKNVSTSVYSASSFLSKPLTNGATDHIQVITTLHGSIEVKYGGGIRPLGFWRSYHSLSCNYLARRFWLNNVSW